jgi:hypothetical protein
VYSDLRLLLATFITRCKIYNLPTSSHGIKTKKKNAGILPAVKTSVLTWWKVNMTTATPLQTGTESTPETKCQVCLRQWTVFNTVARHSTHNTAGLICVEVQLDHNRRFLIGSKKKSVFVWLFFAAHQSFMFRLHKLLLGTRTTDICFAFTCKST